MSKKEENPYFKITKIGCIGAGYVGGTTLPVFASKIPDKKFVIYDIDKEKIDQWNSDKLPIYEPGLKEIVKSCKGKNLMFSNKFEDLLGCEMIFISVGTPTKTHGFGKGSAANLTYIELCTRSILKHFKKGRLIVVEKSTVPVKTSDHVKKILFSENNPNIEFHVLSNPEFLAEGTAVKDILNPDRVLIGGENDQAVESLVRLYNSFIPRENIITTNCWSSELSKLVANTFLAQRVSSINGISALCDKTGADIMEVSKACGSDHRLGKYFLHPSIGFGGSCFQKDILNLCYLCEHYGLPEVAEYFRQIIKINEFQKKRFAKKIVQSMFDTVDKKKIAIFGFAFKANTSDTRESCAIYICRYLLEERAYLRVWDPKVRKDQMFLDLNQMMNGSYHVDPVRLKYDKKLVQEIVTNHVTKQKDPYEAVEGCSAIVVCTEWKEFKDYDYQKLYDKMQKPAWIFDGRVILDHKKLRDIGFNVYCIGKPLIK